MPPREHDLAAENERLREANEALRHEVKVLSAKVAAQEAVRDEYDALRHEVEVLSAKVADLEARFSQSSRNSSLPPSSDSPKSRAERRAAQREAAKARGAEDKRARGKQPGAPGATLMRRARPDEVVVHEPEHCDSCGKDLTCAAVEGEVSRQVYDTPDPVLVCTEHRSVKKRCSCGTLNAGSFPPEARGPVSYGPNVRGAALYLLHAQHCSVERTARALSEMLGAPVSTGFVASLAAEAAGSLGPFLAEVAERLVASPVVHVDETPDQVRTDTVWFHVCATDLYTFLYASDTRGKAAPDEAGVLGRFTGTMVHDRLRMYFNSAPRGALTYPPRSGEGLEVTSLGPMAYLDSKEKGNNSMPLSRLSCPGVWGEEMADPRDMAKARLLEVQSPVAQVHAHRKDA